MSGQYNTLLSLVKNILDLGESKFLSDRVSKCMLFETSVREPMKKYKSTAGRCSYDNCSSCVALSSSNALNSNHNKIFVVHGRDNETKEACARFLVKLGLEPIILQEQPNGGQMIIDKLERYTDVDFAVVLMTHDDVGGLKGETLGCRARQNVIFELGLLIEKLGRSRIAILMNEDIEIPSDINGISYIPIDSYGAWRTKLAQELKNADYDIDLRGLIS